MCELSLPNREIVVYKKEVLDHLVNFIPSSTAISIQEAIYTGNTEKLQATIRQLLLQTVSFYDTAGEIFYHGLILGLCAIMDSWFEIRSYRESGEGRYDIQLKPRIASLPGILIELKAAKPGDGTNLKALAQVALNQIEEKQYAIELQANGVSSILKYGVAFQGKEVEICASLGK